MRIDFALLFNSVMLGVGLAMDAFSVSLANGLNEPTMKKRREAGVALVFSLFQAAMPMIGWICVSTVARQFAMFERFIPCIALILLGFIGGKMLVEGIKCKGCEVEKCPVCFTALLVQGVATSIDALSVGFTISGHSLPEAIISCSVIGAVTFFVCFAGVEIGKRAGTRLAGKAGILGGIILIAIGVEIFITSFI